MDADVAGAAQLARSLDVAADELAQLHPTEAAALLEAAGADASPRRTGALASTVAAQVSAGLVTVTAGNTTVNYAAAVHARDPFLTRTAQQNADRVVASIADDVDTVLDKITGA